MILTPKSMSYINMYRVETSQFLSAGIDSGITVSERIVLASDIEQAMDIVRGFYNRDDISKLKFRTVEYIGQAMYVLDYLKARKGVLREAQEQPQTRQA